MVYFYFNFKNKLGNSSFFLYNTAISFFNYSYYEFAYRSTPSGFN